MKSLPKLRTTFGSMSHDRKWRVRQVAFVAVGAICVVVVAILLWRWSGGTRTALATWLESVATLSAFGAAVVAGTFAARAVGIERERDERWMAQQRSSQASCIAAWWTRLNTEMHDGFNVVTAVHVRLRNASNLPVSRVTLETALVWPTNSGGSGRTDFIQVDHGVLPPHEPADGLVEVRVPVPTMQWPAGATIEVELSFVDAGGQSWTRMPDGQLIPA